MPSDHPDAPDDSGAAAVSAVSAASAATGAAAGAEAPGARVADGARTRTLRPATHADISALADLWAYAFPGERTPSERARALREGGVYGGIESSWVVEEEGRLAAAFRTYPLRCWVHGRCEPTMGLAAVAVVPEFRRRGLGRWACEQALRIGRERGDTMSLLFPFRVSFYENLGYALAGELHRYRFAPSDLALSDGWQRVERVTGDAQKEVREVYGRVARQGSGLLERNGRMWRFQRENGLSTLIFRGSDGAPRGYAVIKPARATTGSTEWTLRVRELLAEDDEAHEALLGWISAQRDQWQEVVYDALPGERFHRRLPHPQRPGSGRARALWFHSATILRGPMARVLNVEKLLAPDGPSDGRSTRPPHGSSDGPLANPGPVRTHDFLHIGEPFRLYDPILPENDGVWEGGEWRPEADEGRPVPQRTHRPEGPENQGAAQSADPSGTADLSIAEFTDRFLNPPGGPDFRLLDTF